MGVRREIPWTTLFIEGVAIVVSILMSARDQADETLDLIRARLVQLQE